MNFDFSKKSLAKSLSERNVALFTCLGLACSNLVVLGALVSKNEKIVLVPQFNIDHRLSVEGGEYSDQYFIDWADSILRSVLSVNPDSVDWKVSEILKISTIQYGAIKKTLSDEATRIKENNLSTVFYPKEFEVNRALKCVLVSGQYLAFIGKDTTPVVKDKTYELSWVLGKQGIVFVKDLMDVTEEDNVESH